MTDWTLDPAKEEERSVESIERIAVHETFLHIVCLLESFDYIKLRFLKQFLVQWLDKVKLVKIWLSCNYKYCHAVIVFSQILPKLNCVYFKSTIFESACVP